MFDGAEPEIFSAPEEDKACHQQVIDGRLHGLEQPPFFKLVSDHQGFKEVKNIVVDSIGHPVFDEVKRKQFIAQTCP